MAKGGTYKEIYKGMLLSSLKSFYAQPDDSKPISKEQLNELLKSPYFDGLELFAKLKKSHNLRKAFLTLNKKFIRDNRKESKIFKLLAKDDFLGEDDLLQIYENSILINEETDNLLFETLEIYTLHQQIATAAKIVSGYKNINKLKSDLKLALDAIEKLKESKKKLEHKYRDYSSVEKNEDSLVKAYVKLIKQKEDIPQNKIFCGLVGISESAFSNIFNSKTFVFKVNERLKKWELSNSTNVRTKNIAKNCIIKLTNKFRDNFAKKEKADAITAWKTRSPIQQEYREQYSYEDELDQKIDDEMTNSRKRS